MPWLFARGEVEETDGYADDTCPRSRAALARHARAFQCDHGCIGPRSDSTTGPLAAAPGDAQIYTGVTAVLPRGHARSATPVWAGQFDLNGNGEMTGTHWIVDAGYFLGPVCLTNTHSVGIVHHASPSAG